MPLVQLAALGACAMLAGLAVFQIALISGAPLGRLAWGGQHEVLPARLRAGSAVSIILYAVFAYAALAKAGMVPFLGKRLSRRWPCGCWQDISPLAWS